MTCQVNYQDFKNGVVEAKKDFLQETTDRGVKGVKR